VSRSVSASVALVVSLEIAVAFVASASVALVTSVLRAVEVSVAIVSV